MAAGTETEVVAVVALKKSDNEKFAIDGWLVFG